MEKKVYQQLATSYTAFLNCIESGNKEWEEKHEQTITDLCENSLPHGSGFDSGTSFDFDASKKNRLVLCTSYHHMDESGYYCGWSDHNVVVTPDLQSGFDLRITGRNVRDIKDYMYDIFSIALDSVPGEW